MEKGLLEKTGHPLSYWIELVRKEKIEKHKAIIDFLKSNHEFTYGYANFVALKTLKSDAASHTNEDLLDNQYQGKEILKPIYDVLLKKIQAFGNDIQVVPKKDSVSLVRAKQFALIKPATKTRIDLGIKLKGEPVGSRLENSGPFGTMCTHRVKLTEAAEVDSELVAWLKMAYDKAV